MKKMFCCPPWTYTEDRCLSKEFLYFYRCEEQSSTEMLGIGSLWVERNVWNSLANCVFFGETFWESWWRSASYGLPLAWEQVLAVPWSTGLDHTHCSFLTSVGLQHCLSSEAELSLSWPLGQPRLDSDQGFFLLLYQKRYWKPSHEWKKIKTETKISYWNRWAIN